MQQRRTTRTRKSVFQQLQLTKLDHSTMGSRQPHGLTRRYAFGSMKKHKLMIWLRVSANKTTVVLYRLKDHRLRSLHGMSLIRVQLIAGCNN